MNVLVNVQPFPDVWRNSAEFGYFWSEFGKSFYFYLATLVVMAAQLLAVTSQLAAKLRFVDYGSILEFNSSVKRSVECHGW